MPPISGNIAVNSPSKLPLNPQDSLKNQVPLSANPGSTAKPDIYVTNNIPPQSQNSYSSVGKPGQAVPSVSNNTIPSGSPAASGSGSSGNGSSYALPSLSGSLTTGGTNPGAASYNAGNSTLDNPARKNSTSSPANAATVADKPSVSVVNNYPSASSGSAGSSASGKSSGGSTPVVTNNISATAPSGGGSGSGAVSPGAAKNPAISLPGVNIASPNPSLNMPVNPNLPNPAASAGIPPIQGQKTGSKTISSSMTAPDAGKKPLQAPIASQPLNDATPPPQVVQTKPEIVKTEPVKSNKKVKTKKPKKAANKTKDKSVYTPVGDDKKLEDIIGR